MSRTHISALAALIVLAVLSVMWPRERGAYEENSFGVVPGGHRAVFELFDELGLSVARSFDPPGHLAPGAVTWWIEPQDWCNAAPSSGTGPDAVAEADPAPRDDAPPGVSAEPWLADGGTAVLFLAARARWTAGAGRPHLAAPPDCRWIGRWSLPARRGLLDAEEAEELAETDEGVELEDADAESVVDRWWRDGLGDTDPGTNLRERLTGELVPRARDLETSGLWRFDAGAEADGWQVQALLDGEPFVLERAVGAGRLVVVADADFLTNRYLDRGDAAPLALDLVRAYGVPRFDEYAHGLRAEERPLVYLAASPALPVFLGLALLGVGLLWHGSVLPRRRARSLDPSAPSLDGFVTSLATLYSRSRDHGRVAERYRDLSLARLRRHFGLAPDTPKSVLLDRLRRQRRAPEAELALLDPDPVAVRSAADLTDWTRRLDALVEEACR